MTYATLTQLTDRYGERTLIDLTDRAAVATGAIDIETVDRALADTDAVIDGYLKRRYRLPISSTPPLLADLAQAIAIYKLHVFAPDPKVQKDYDDAMRMLREISSGDIRLDLDGVEPAGSGASGVKTTDRERPMTAENLKGYI